MMACKELGDLDESKYIMYRLNGLEEPTFPLRRDNAEVLKCNVSNGELLMLCSKSETKLEDRLQINVHLTMTGQPEDSQFLDKIQVS